MQQKKNLQVGDLVPNFTCDTNQGQITFHDAIDGQFAILVTFPRDFDPVATTEVRHEVLEEREYREDNNAFFNRDLRFIGVSGRGG